MEAEKMGYVNEKSLFIKLDSYKKTLEQINVLKAKVEEAKGIFSKISDLKREEDTEMSIWQGNLAQVESKMKFIEKTLLEPGVQ
ncbi:MAG: hypothetical protein QXK37_00335 [Candidatus Woesearchaeota archaeon]